MSDLTYMHIVPKGDGSGITTRALVTEKGDILRILQGAVEGLIECVALYMPNGDHVADMWINEEGLYKFTQSDHNSRATELAELRGRLGPFVTIRGPVAITGPCDQHGNTKSLSKAAVRRLSLTETAEEVA